MEEKKQIMSQEIRHFRKKNPKIADTIIKNSSFSKSNLSENPYFASNLKCRMKHVYLLYHSCQEATTILKLQ